MERHPRHGAVLADCLEILGDNDTTAGDHGSRSGVRGVLQRGRVLQGIGQSARRSFHIPAHAGGGEIKNHDREKLYADLRSAALYGAWELFCG